MKKYQVVGIGNAIVDVITQADESFLELMGIEKGIMQLVERERGELLYAAMNDRVQAPGGLCGQQPCRAWQPGPEDGLHRPGA